ncbi:MAG: ATP-binding cassette domain-containing protein [Tepidisphaera sp.]|nr:ATP-binding cassette domain-containing protein [Tepidisphaera sp.]
MTDALIKLRDIRRTFHLGEIDLQVLRGISLDINRGELVSLTGPSGSGKSTLMNILGCLDRPTSGEYWLDGVETSGLSNDRRAMIRNQKIGFVFQSFNLLPRTSALEQVMMPLAYTASGLSEREAKKRAVALLDRVGLAQRLDHTPAQLSGGQQQRIAIARALINHPPVLFADEPTGNLDSKTTNEILAMFQALNADEGITIVIVTHDPFVASHTKRNVHLIDGLIDSDTPNERMARLTAGEAAQRAPASMSPSATGATP